MADNDGQKKKDEEIDPSVIKIPTHINIDGSTSHIPLFAGTEYRGTSDLTIRTSNLDAQITTIKDYAGGGVFTSPTVDITGHGAIYTGVQPIILTTNAGILGATTLGENLLDMKINTIGDARNFLVGVNNVASVFSANSGLLNAIESASAVALNHGRLTIEAMDRVNIQSATKGIELATAYHLDGRQMVKLSESVTTVLAYGQAVETKFGTDAIISHESMLRNGLIGLRDSSVTLGKPLDYLTIDSEAITSPFIFTPKAIDTTELLKQIPAIKDDLIEAKKEADKFFKKLENIEKDVKTKDQKIENQEEAIKLLREQIDIIKKDIIVIRDAKFVGSLTEDFEVGQLSCKNNLVYYGRDYVHFPPQERGICLLLMQASKEKDSLVYEDTLSQAVSTRKGLSHKNLLKLVSGVRRTLKSKNDKIRIEFLNGESFMMILNNIR